MITVFKHKRWRIITCLFYIFVFLTKQIFMSIIFISFMYINGKKNVTITKEIDKIKRCKSRYLTIQNKIFIWLYLLNLFIKIKKINPHPKNSWLKR
jgi:hypothetical protein